MNKKDRFKVLTIRSHALIIEETGIQNFLSIDPVTLMSSSPTPPAPSADQMEKNYMNGNKDVTTQDTRGKRDIAVQVGNDKSQGNTSRPTISQAFLIGMKIRHDVPKKASRCTVCL